MKILEVCPYSAGICGVWSRAREEAVRLAKRGHEVRVFSSDFEKGTGKKVGRYDEIGGVKIERFPAKKLGGESFMSWDYKKEALEYGPEAIIVHNYRHLHTTKALRIAKELRKMRINCRVFLVTHAPFVEGNITRKWYESLIVRFYDYTFGRRSINKFDGIFPISNWEIKYLKKIGAREDKITYIPNGIPGEFFSMKKNKSSGKEVLFLGRIARKKKIETLLQAFKILKNSAVLEIVGPAEKDYYDYLVGVSCGMKNVKFIPPIYETKEKIEKIDSCKVFVLPSRVEGMPQSLIEAMARGRIVIGSDSEAIRDLIKDGKNGFLFEFNNAKDLARVIDKALSYKGRDIQVRAAKDTEKFNWDIIIDKLESAIK